MNIGKKIKELRTSKLMTQSELAGSEITRNMLSRIENGAAQPSLDTLIYLASRLNVSPGFLLAESEDERVYLKHNEIHGIKTAYLTGDYHICRDMCLNSSIADDDEIQMILAECTQSIAVEEFFVGHLHSACEYFDMALRACASTVYNTDYIVSVCAVYFNYMKEISATLSSNYIDETDTASYFAMRDVFCRYVSQFIAAKNGEEFRVCKVIGAEDVYSLHIDAIKHMSEGRYSEGYECLHKILISDTRIPDPMIYFVFCDLEICCKEISDFKGAYEYSINKLELLQRLLSQ